MGKYAFKKKLGAVQNYCSGNLGLKAVAKEHDVNVSSLRQWISAYRANGIEGLKEKRREFYSVALSSTCYDGPKKMAYPIARQAPYLIFANLTLLAIGSASMKKVASNFFPEAQDDEIEQ